MTSTRAGEDGDAEVMTTHVTSSMRRARAVTMGGTSSSSRMATRPSLRTTVGNGNGNDGDTDEWVN